MGPARLFPRIPGSNFKSNALENASFCYLAFNLSTAMPAYLSETQTTTKTKRNLIELDVFWPRKMSNVTSSGQICRQTRFLKKFSGANPTQPLSAVAGTMYDRESLMNGDLGGLDDDGNPIPFPEEEEYEERGNSRGKWCVVSRLQQRSYRGRGGWGLPHTLQWMQTLPNQVDRLCCSICNTV